jgi:hypothetical protein
MSITIEAETRGETETLFRVLFDATTIGAGLTSTEAQTLVGQNLRKLASSIAPSWRSRRLDRSLRLPPARGGLHRY